MTELQSYSMNSLYGRKKVESIGKSIYDMKIALVDDRNQIYAPGEIKEIIVHGGSMTAGYWNNPELTAQTIRQWFGQF